MLKNTNETIKTGTNFDLTTDTFIQKYQNILIKLKILIFSIYC